MKESKKKGVCKRRIVSARRSDARKVYDGWGVHVRKRKSGVDELLATSVRTIKPPHRCTAYALLERL